MPNVKGAKAAITMEATAMTRKGDMGSLMGTQQRRRSPFESRRESAVIHRIYTPAWPWRTGYCHLIIPYPCIFSEQFQNKKIISGT
jgi:hypothetical protein